MSGESIQGAIHIAERSISEVINQVMAIVSLGDREANWETKGVLIYPWVRLTEGKAYLFFLSQAEPTRETEFQYLVVLPEIRAQGETYQTAMDCKYFPGTTTMVFSVAIPDAEVFKDPEIRIVLLPKEFKKGSATIKSLDIELAYDNQEMGDLSFPFT